MKKATRKKLYQKRLLKIYIIINKVKFNNKMIRDI
jgi:hypothetical protein